MGWELICANPYAEHPLHESLRMAWIFKGWHMAKLLTKRKQAWVDKRKPQVIRGAPLNNPSILEEKFARRLEQLVAKMCDDVNQKLARFFTEPHAEEYFDAAQDASVSSQARILSNALMKKFNGMFSSLAPTIAEQQLNAVNAASSSAVHSSLRDLSGGLSLPTTGITSDMQEVLSASTTEMVGLIKSISQEYLSGVQGQLMRSITSGRGLADLTPYLEKHKGITQRRARMIAQDQTRKAYNNLNRGRMEKLGLSKFEWLHTGGSAHPRKLHQSYNGKIFSFGDPPVVDENTGERGIPGTAINCRCRMRVVLEFDTEGK
jgi:SPP1 gp7 family putative phage head morphogenesis protein